MNYKEALKYSMDLCSRQEKCKSEVSEKLASFRLPPGDIEKVIKALENEDFINDSRYAGNFARDKLRLNKWGKIKIRYMLVQKKLPDHIISLTLDEIDENYYLEILREELAKKRSTIRGSNAFELRGKLFRFAQQRGFEAGLIYGIIDEIL